MFNDIKNWFNDALQWCSDALEPFKNFIFENSNNPFLWIGLIIIGLIIFELTFRTLHKD